MKVWESEIKLEVGEKGFVILVRLEDGAFCNAAIVEVVVAIGLVFFDGIFTGHILILSRLSTFKETP